jgi:hypothetical protein
MANNSPDRQVCMASIRNAEDDEVDPQYDNKQLANVVGVLLVAHRGVYPRW